MENKLIPLLLAFNLPSNVFITLRSHLYSQITIQMMKNYLRDFLVSSDWDISRRLSDVEMWQREGHEIYLKLYPETIRFRYSVSNGRTQDLCRSDIISTYFNLIQVLEYIGHASTKFMYVRCANSPYGYEPETKEFQKTLDQLGWKLESDPKKIHLTYVLGNLKIDLNSSFSVSFVLEYKNRISTLIHVRNRLHLKHIDQYLSGLTREYRHYNKLT